MNLFLLIIFLTCIGIGLLGRIFFKWPIFIGPGIASFLLMILTCWLGLIITGPDGLAVVALMLVTLCAFAVTGVIAIIESTIYFLWDRYDTKNQSSE